MKIKTSVVLLALTLAVPLALLAQSASPVTDSPDADKDLIDKRTTADLPAAPTVDQTTTSKLVYGLLSDSRYAYRPRQLDAATSQDVFKRYLESLDSGKQFFTKEDVDRFAPLAAQTGDAIRSGELDPAYQVFAVYRQRGGERVAYPPRPLQQHPAFT